MEKEKLQEIELALKQKYKKHKAIISKIFMKSLQIILDNNAKMTAEEFLAVLNNSEDKIVLEDENYKIVIDFSGEDIVVDNHCIVSGVTVQTTEPMHIVCDIPERFNKVFAYKDETSTFVMPNGLKNATSAEKFVNSGAGSSITRALGIDLKTITPKQIKVLLTHLLEEDTTSYLAPTGVKLGEQFFNINCGMLETDFCDIAFLPDEGLVIDYDDGKVKTYKSYSVDQNGDVTYRKQEFNFYNFSKLEAVNYRYDAEKEDGRTNEKLLTLKAILEKGTTAD